MKSSHSRKIETSGKKGGGDRPPLPPSKMMANRGLWLWILQHPGTSLVLAIALILSAVLGTFLGTQFYIQGQIDRRDRDRLQQEKFLRWVQQFAPDERQGAILALGSLENPEAQIQLLADLLGLETDPERFAAVQQALVSSGPNALPYLQKLNQSTRTDLDALRYSTDEEQRQVVEERLRSTQRAIAKLLQLYSAQLAHIDLNRTHLAQLPDGEFTLVLEKTDLSGIQLRGALLNHGSFRGSQFYGAGKDGNFGTYDDETADFTSSELADSDFTEAFLSHAVFAYSNLTRATLDRANLFRVILTKANLDNAQLIGADLRQADLTDAILPGANLSQANLAKTQAIGARLPQVSATGANFYQALLSATDWQGANLQGANLRQSNLENANLSATQLIDADLRGAQLQNVNLRQADLTSAQLQGATVDGADFRGAKFLTAQGQQSDRFLESSNNSFSGLLRGVDFTKAQNLDDKQIVYICTQGGTHPLCSQMTEELSPENPD